MDEQKFNDICAAIVSGSAVRRALIDNGVNPNVFYPWLDARPEAAKQYARAIDSGCDALADAAFELADNLDIPADHKRIMVDTRKWYLSKRAAKKYGDKTTQEHVGPGGGPVQVESVQRTIIDPKHPDSEGV